MSTPTPRTDMATYPADCLGTTLVTNRDCSRALERELAELTAERDQLRACLRDLVDEQNGAPLELRRTHWQAAMDEALAALTKTEGAK